jgi:hypothetical protein
MFATSQHPKMQGTPAFTKYETGPEMSKSDMSIYFDLAAASQGEPQAGEDINMNEWVENVVSSHHHYSDSMDVDMVVDMATDSYQLSYHMEQTPISR